MACGGGGHGTPSPTQPSPVPSPTPTPTPTPAPTAPLQPTFSSIRTQVFQVWCVACHTGVGRSPDGGLRLDASAAYGELVNVQSTGKPEAGRVVPGDPDRSYLIHKLEGRADIEGSRMPLGGPFLVQTDIDVIRTWIAQGAPNN
jgi:mono/diheme cytochrome c family protein